MTIAREEIFGPVLTTSRQGRSRRGEDRQRHALRPAGYVSAGSVECTKVGRRIRAGNVNLQGVPNDRTAPFGGYKQSGNGREWGKYGLEEYLEVKAVAGYDAA
jgi:aldehyde dehydrogenase (NAD+)